MPRFPFKRSVAQDLRDLWAIDRVDRQARNLGLSSLSPGDGSLDLIDGGTTVARYGDLPGGGFGIGVPDGSGGWRTVQQDAQARADGAVGPLASEITTARGGFANLNARLSDHASRLGGTEGRLTTAEGRLDSHASRIGATENVANGVQSEVSTARGGFGSLNGRLNDHAARIGSAEGEIDTIDERSLINTFRYTQLRSYVVQLKYWLDSGMTGPDPGIPPDTYAP